MAVAQVRLAGPCQTPFFAQSRWSQSAGTGYR